MSQVIKLVSISLFSFSLAYASSNCAEAGTAAWSKQVRNLVDGCRTSISSPDKKKTLVMKGNGELGFSFLGEPSVRPTNYKVEPPAMVSWSPTSLTFFVNDGEGSGMSSIFRLFRISGERVTRDDSIQQAAITRYRKTVGCLPSAIDPNVWGLGWSADGKQVFLLVQATANESCGDQDSFISLIVNTSDSSVAEQLTHSQTTRRFRSLLPRELLQK